MNKHAAEKIASEYYNLGIQLALQGAGLTKTARPSAGQLAAMLGGGGAAATLGTGASGEALMNAIRSINPTAKFDPVKLQAIMGGLKRDAAAAKGWATDQVGKAEEMLENSFLNY